MKFYQEGVFYCKLKTREHKKSFQIRVHYDIIVMRETSSENGRTVFGKEANVWKKCRD